jgi:hypothetical protein
MRGQIGASGVSDTTSVLTAIRQHVVSQFNIVRTRLVDNETTPLQVGNGNFAFNVDNTGMQVHSIQYSSWAIMLTK